MGDRATQSNQSEAAKPSRNQVDTLREVLRNARHALLTQTNLELRPKSFQHDYKCG